MARKDKKRRKTHKGKPYKHPIPGPNEVIDFLENAGRPLRAEPIMDAFGLKGQRMRTLLIACVSRSATMENA